MTTTAKIVLLTSTFYIDWQTTTGFGVVSEPAAEATLVDGSAAGDTISRRTAAP